MMMFASVKILAWLQLRHTHNVSVVGLIKVLEITTGLQKVQVIFRMDAVHLVLLYQNLE